MDKVRDRLQWTKSLHSAFVCINFLSADCPTIPISSGLPRFCLKISNLDQYMIRTGKISILTSLPEHQILSVISWNCFSKNYRSCQKYITKNRVLVREATQRDKATKGPLSLRSAILMVLSKSLVIAYKGYRSSSTSGFQWTLVKISENIFQRFS